MLGLGFRTYRVCNVGFGVHRFIEFRIRGLYRVAGTIIVLMCGDHGNILASHTHKNKAQAPTHTQTQTQTSTDPDPDPDKNADADADRHGHTRTHTDTQTQTRAQTHTHTQTNNHTHLLPVSLGALSGSIWLLSYSPGYFEYGFRK